MSSTLDPDDLELARDVPTTRDDVGFLRRRAGNGENLLPRLEHLSRAVRTLGLHPGRDTAEGWAPFELDETSES